ncbi:PSP1-domain-containing protein [Hymenopellis radicata]|nr:PSP1-domain-containing protein [Hymenopellis radicata]
MYHHHKPSDDDDRTNRFLDPTSDGAGFLRERAASQPPHSSAQSMLASSPAPSLRQGPWATHGLLNTGASRSLSFSARSPSEVSVQTQFSPFASTFEDDESEDFFAETDDHHSEQFIPSSLSRGRSYAQDISRSRSHSLAVERPTPIGSPFLTTTSRMASWNESGLPMSRYGDVRRPGYGTGHSPSGVYTGFNDGSNMSPFMRDVLLASSHPRDGDNGGGSGTTSRRHSVSVVKPRTAIVGFNAPGAESQQSQQSRGGGLMLSDEDLAGDFDSLSLNSIIMKGPSQPSSMPTYARSPPGASFHPMNFQNRTPEEDRFHAPPPQFSRSPSTPNGSSFVNATTSPTHIRAQSYSHTLPLFIVEFKAGRTDLFYLTDTSQDIRVGDLVIVEADRGKDLGRVINDTITAQDVEAHRASIGEKKEINPKVIYSKATRVDVEGLAAKAADEARALDVCRMKVRGRKLPMEVVDAEYQWDRHKLTFYYITEKRIDFRELVRELFRLYKTRIWMSSLQGNMNEEVV